MTLVMMLGLSLAWGAVVICIAAGLQRLGMTGRMRQMLWRFSGVLLLAPFAAAGVYEMLGPDMVEPVWTWGEGGAPRVPVAVEVQTLPHVAATTPAVHRSATTDWSLPSMLGAVLALGWFVRAVLARRASAELAMVTRRSEPVRSRAVLSAADRWARRLGLSRTPQLRLMAGDFSPFTQGVRRPVVYLPHGLEARLSHNEMDLVIGHELMHVRRGDAVWRPFERAIADVLWFNPCAWFVRGQLERARELACDEAMIAREAPASVYARALVSVARFAAGLPTHAPAAAMFPFDKDKVLPERVKAAAASRGRSSRAALFGLAVFAAAGVPLAVAQGAGAPKQRLPIPDFTATVVDLDKARISSPFGERVHPKTGDAQTHDGIDVAAPLGTPIRAPADGVVKHVDRNDGFGLYVKILFNDEWIGRFANMSQAEVKGGQRVAAGDVIGYVGTSGKNSTGPHLHMEIWGPAADFDRTGDLAAYDPTTMGLAATPAQALNAAQIRRLGVILKGPAGEDVTTSEGQRVETFVETKDGKVLHRVVRIIDDADGEVVSENMLGPRPEGGIRVVVGGVVHEGDAARKLLKDHGAISDLHALDGMVIDLDVSSVSDLDTLSELGELGRDDGKKGFSFFALGDGDWAIEGPKPPAPPAPPGAPAPEAGVSSDSSTVQVFSFTDDEGKTTTRVISRGGQAMDRAEVDALRAEAMERAAEARSQADAAREAAHAARDAARDAAHAARDAAAAERDAAHAARDHAGKSVDHADDQSALEGAIEAAFEQAMAEGLDEAELEQAFGKAISGLIDVTLNATTLGLEAAADAMSDMDLSGEDVNLNLNGKQITADDRAEIEDSLAEIEAEIRDAESRLKLSEEGTSAFEARIELAALKTARASLKAALSATR